MSQLNKELWVSSSPHIRGPVTTQRLMMLVIIALMPAFAVSIYVFGARVLLICALCIGTCIVTELVMEKILKKPSTISDLSAVVTGLLLAYNLPISIPWWACVIGSIFAIALVKQAFGGLGDNFINPALAARAFLLASWPIHMTSSAYLPVDAVTTATPLGILKEGLNLPLPSNLDMFTGLNGVYGSIGEISALALLIGGIFLICMGVISWRIPVCYLGTVAVMALCFGEDPIFQLCAGGLMLGAFFMATDYVTSPNTPKGQIIFAVGCGLLTMIIRKFGSYPEGVSYSILLMNCAAPLIAKYTAPRVYGTQKKKKTESEAA